MGDRELCALRRTRQWVTRGLPIRMLTPTLRSLERDGLIGRTACEIRRVAGEVSRAAYEIRDSAPSA